MNSVDNDYPVPFGYKMGWLAIRSTDVTAVANSLQLVHPQHTTWEKGLEAVYGSDAYVFVTPEMNGWILVVGRWFLSEKLKSLITKLSAQFGEAQAFATHRVVEYHHWMLARNGRLLRGFAFSGSSGIVYFNIGQLTAAERSFGWDSLSLFEWLPNEENVMKPEERSFPSDSSAELESFPSEEDVMTVAGQWSIDPTTLSEGTSVNGNCMLGKVSQST